MLDLAEKIVETRAHREEKNGAENVFFLACWILIRDVKDFGEPEDCLVKLEGSDKQEDAK